MLLANLLSVAAPLLALSTSVHGAGVGGHVNMPAKGAAPNQDPVPDTPCVAYTKRIPKDYDMIQLTPKYGFYGDGNPQGYLAGFTGSALTISTGDHTRGKSDVVNLVISGPDSNYHAYAYYINRNDHCTAHGITPDLSKMDKIERAGYKVTIWATGL